MIIKTPQKYFSEPDIIKKAGKYIAEYSKKPLIIGSSSALKAAFNDLKSSLDEHGINSENVETFRGYPSENQIQKYSRLASDLKADAIIALGGGRTLDTAKAAGELAEVPVITIPTIAATCAAWAALTIQYDDEGSFVKPRPLKSSPVLILADTKIILSAPKRYLFAGVADTFAKLYEVRPTFEHYPDSISLDIALYSSKVAFDKLEKNVFTALDEAEKGIYGQAAKDVVDSVIYLAGFAGSFQNEVGYYSFAHPFYHISARFPNTRHKLHGEKVAYGIISQLFLEGKEKEYTADSIRLFDKYGNAFTLEDIGLSADNTDELYALADDVKKDFSYVLWSRDEIVEALLSANKLTKEILKN
ncbi:MAG: iron-containing alcohol dehydrogenase family protein [Ruminococcus sp.]|nr:iron-containing alcohol dehydrogenase family protein [Ruminococcus sp.]